MPISKRQQESIDQHARELFEALAKTAVAKVELEQVRSNRNLSAEHVMDAARNFRSAEAHQQEALDRLLALQCSILKGEAEREEGAR